MRLQWLSGTLNIITVVVYSFLLSLKKESETTNFRNEHLYITIRGKPLVEKVSLLNEITSWKFSDDDTEVMSLGCGSLIVQQ